METTKETPVAVTRAAAQQQFGHLVAARIGANSPLAGLGVGGLALGAIGLGIALAWLASLTEIRLLALFAFFTFCALFPVLTGFAVLMIVRGSQSYYLYQGGLIRTWNGRPRPVAWHQIRQVVRQRVNPKHLEAIHFQPGLEWVTAETVSGYLIRPAGGPPLRIQIGGFNDPDYAPFCENLEQLASQSGAVVTG